MVDDETVINLIGLNIRKFREDKGLTQAELGDLVNMEDSAIRRLEAGRTNPTIRTLCKLSNALGINIQDLMEE